MCVIGAFTQSVVFHVMQQVEKPQVVAEGPRIDIDFDLGEVALAGAVQAEQLNAASSDDEEDDQRGGTMLVH